MKKTLIAMAVLAASGASFAQVTLYGVVGAGYQQQRATVVAAGVSTETRTDGISNVAAIGGGRFGMRGTEDLGGGLSANFNLEATANTSDGTDGGATTANQLFNRQSTIGLAGGFGEVKLGRTFTPVYQVVGASDVFDDTGISTVNMTSAATLAGGNRASNGIFYTTPNTLGGFNVKAMFGTIDTGISSGTAATATAAKTQNSGLSVGYAAGPLAVSAGLGYNETDTAAAGAAVVNARNDAQAISFSYDFGPAKLFAGYVKNKLTADTSLNSYVENSETNVGVSVPLGAVTLLAGLGRNSRTTVANGAETATATGTGNDWALGAYYNLSKRTVAYVKTGVFNKFDFGATAVTNAGNRQDTTASAIGLRHAF